MKSIRKVTASTEFVSYVHKVLKVHKLLLYKMQILHELHKDDSDKRVQLHEVQMTDVIRQNPNLFLFIYFSDEYRFYLKGFVNKYNCQYWSDENPHTLLKAIHEHHKK